MDLATYIWQFRLSKSKVAKDLNVTRNSIHGICNRTQTPSIKLAIRIIDYTEGRVGIQNIYPQLFEAYKRAIKKKGSQSKN